MSKEEIVSIMNMTDEDINKMSYKEKQEYFKNRNRIVKVIYKNEHNKPYVKPIKERSVTNE
jgi:hypothetical protein